MRLEDYLLKNVSNQPSKIALQDSRRTITYSEMLNECREMIVSLRARGIQPGDRVAVISRNRVEFILSAFACFLGGYIFQPVNFRLSPTELSYVLQDSEPSTVIIEAEQFPELLALVESRKDITIVVKLHEKSGFDWGRGDASSDSVENYRPAVDPTRIAALLYTGGTTGGAKGTVLSHDAWLLSSRDGAYALRLTRHDKSYICVPLFHVSFVHFLSLFYLGITVMLGERVRSDEVVDAIVNGGATHIVLVQAPLVDLLNYLRDNKIVLPKIRTLQYGGSPIAPSVIERVSEVFGDVLYQNYGLTEIAGGATYLPPEDHSPSAVGDVWRKRVRSAGYSMPGAEIGIFSDEGNLLSSDTLGEVWIRSEAVMDGYWRNEKATKEAITPDGWLKTGDMGRLDADGYLYIVDRKKDMIISGGENIYARDVEDVLLSHPDIREVAVVGAPDDRLGEKVVAFLVMRDGVSLTKEELNEWLSKALSSYKKPSRVFFETELPRTTVGKIYKPTLRAWLAEGRYD